MSFCITRHKGIVLTFKNGCAISIQWGPGNYCDRKGEEYDAPKKTESWEAKTAEIAIFGADGEFLRIQPHDNVIGWVPVEHALRIMAWVQALPEGPTRANTKVPEWVDQQEPVE